MKMNIKGLVFVGFAAAVFASAAKADLPTGDAAKKAVTSVSFTEATYEKKANKVQTLNPQATAEQKASNYPSQAAIEALVGAEYSGTGLISVNANHVISTSAEENVQANWDETSDTSDAYIANKPSITNAAADITSATVADTKELPTTYAVQQYVDNKVGATYTGEDLIQVDENTHVITTTAEANVIDAVTVGGTAATMSGKTVQLGAAANKAVDTAITDQNATSTDLPTTKAVYDYVADATGTLYTAETGSLITVDNTNHTIGTTAEANVIDAVTVGGTAATMSGKTVQLGAAANKAVDTTITSAAADTEVPTSKAVYDYVSTYAPTIEAIPGTCTAATPCALVAAGNGAKWEPIQQ